MPLNDQSMIGLGNRFLVTVDAGQKDLGSWAKADGLDVQWEVPDYRMGDQWNARLFAPANTKYSTVKLTRAAEAKDSQTVRDWLNENAKKHMLNLGITIELQDSYKKKVLNWTLRNVVVKKWAITTFDAGQGSIAIETLELDHEGFLEDDQQ
jgi:phage tail-like protein